MLVNQANLDALRVGFQTSFNNGLGRADTAYERIATVITATTKETGRYLWARPMCTWRRRSATTVTTFLLNFYIFYKFNFVCQYISECNFLCFDIVNP